MAKAVRKTTKTASAKNVLTMPRLAANNESATTPGPTVNDIAKRAFELFCERGCLNGYDLDDWLRAERELYEKVSSAA